MDHGDISQNIIELSEKIESDYPELYVFLEEIPIAESAPYGRKPSPGELKKYFDTLSQLLRSYSQMHQLKSKKPVGEPAL